MAFYASAYLGEIWRGCIQAVPWPMGSRDGARLHPAAAIRYVILPQAMRIAIPPTVGFIVQLVKNTSIASIIGVVELTRAGKLINNATFQPFMVFVTVALIYFAHLLAALAAGPAPGREAQCPS